MAALLIVKAEIEDHDAWRESFDMAAEFRDALGIEEVSIHHEPGKNTTIVVLHTFASVEAAEAFIANPELAEKMAEGGVIGAPRLEIFETVG
jgi:hypothetical protein